MNTIYTARDRPTREQCVLKVLPLSRVSEASYLSRRISLRRPLI